MARDKDRRVCRRKVTFRILKDLHGSTASWQADSLLMSQTEARRREDFVKQRLRIAIASGRRKMAHPTNYLLIILTTDVSQSQENLVSATCHV